MTSTRPLVAAVAAMRPDPWRVLLAVVAGTGALATTIALMGTSGWLISRAAQQPPVLYLMLAVVAVRAFGIGRGVLRYAERLVSHDVALRGATQLRETLYRRLATGDPARTGGLRRGDLLTRIGSDVDALGDVVVRSLLPFATAALTCGLSVAAMALVLPRAGAILGIGLLIAGVAAPWLAGLAARRAISDTVAARSAMSTHVLALLDGLPEFTVAGVVPSRIIAADRSDVALSDGLDQAARPAAWAAALSTGAMGAAMLGCLIEGTRAVSQGTLQPVMLAVLTLVPLAVVEVVTPLPGAAAVLVRAQLAARNVAAILDAPQADETAKEVRPQPLTDTPARTAHLTVAGLSCGWSGTPPTLTGVSLDLAPGRKVAIIGPSGEGKTTLLRTLAGLLPAQAGQVTLDGTRLQDVPSAQLRQTLSFTADDAHIFTTTVRENVRIARPGAGDDAVRQAIAAAGLGSWLAALPSGLDTVVGDPSGPSRGAGAHALSGGERRRLLAARALISGAAVLLVDEPAEHLDPDAADQLLDALFATGATVVVVTHRLSPLSVADEVLVVADGSVIARGTHDELIARYPAYRDAWAAESTLPATRQVAADRTSGHRG